MISHKKLKDSFEAKKIERKATLLNAETLKNIKDKQIFRFFIKYKMHFGHHKKYLKKEFKSFLFCFFNDYGIIHLKKTLAQLRITMHVLYHIGLQQQKILIIDTPILDADTIRKELFGSKHISSLEQINWIPGLLSNHEQVTKILKNYLMEPNIFKGKDIGKEEKEEDKRNLYHLILSSVKNIDAIIILDPNGSKDIIKEAAIANIPVIAIADLNCSLSHIDYPIVSNNQNRGSVLMILRLLCSAFNKGLYVYWFYNKNIRQKNERSYKLPNFVSTSSINVEILDNSNKTDPFLGHKKKGISSTNKKNHEKITKKKFQKRSKIQWASYFKKPFRKKNVLFIYPLVFLKLRYQKWKLFERHAWKYLKYKFYKYKSPLSSIQRLKSKRQYFRFSLNQKQLFKVLYRISSEKRLKNLLRKSFKRKQSRQKFYSLLQRRLDFFLVRIQYVSSLKKAQFLIKHQFILINDIVVTQFHYVVKCNDVLSIDFRVRKYIYKYILKENKKRLTFKEGRQYRFNVRSLYIPKIIEINYKTLDAILYKDFPIFSYKTQYDLNIDFIHKLYRR